ncbi:MAG: hypothetical protein KGH99_01600 [Thaumarchaeota archaeon]|nr:hypothetical protein [Nitrososphaerota archaeon]MDE1872154.1 hypothetical protein [Nitrososphaerota archaeon]
MNSNLPLQQSFEQTPISIDTTKGSYNPGDSVDVKGNLAGSPGQLVAVQVKDPSGGTLLVRTVKTGEGGNFELTFKLPSTAKAGSYGITASANINGNTVTNAKEITTTVTVPEFHSTTSMILIISIILMVILSTKNKLLKN